MPITVFEALLACKTYSRNFEFDVIDDDGIYTSMFSLMSRLCTTRFLLISLYTFHSGYVRNCVAIKTLNIYTVLSGRVSVGLLDWRQCLIGCANDYLSQARIHARDLHLRGAAVRTVRISQIRTASLLPPSQNPSRNVAKCVHSHNLSGEMKPMVCPMSSILGKYVN